MGDRLGDALERGSTGASRTVRLRRRRQRLVAVASGLLLAVGGAAAFSLATAREEPWDGLLLDPEGLALDAEGRIYVADEDRMRLVVLDPDGRVVEVVSEVAGAPPPVTCGDSLVVLAPGRVVLVRVHELWDLRLGLGSGEPPELVRAIGRRGRAEGEFQDPEGLARDAAGRLWVTDEDNRRVQVFEADGAFLRAWPVPDDPEGICVAGDRVYVTFSKADWIGCYDLDGHLRFRFGEDQLDTPDFLCVGPDGRLYVTDQGNDRIVVFDAAGAFLFAIGGSGHEPGRFHDPEDLAFDAAGRLYVADGGNHRIQVLTADGEPLRVIQ